MGNDVWVPVQRQNGQKRGYYLGIGFALGSAVCSLDIFGRRNSNHTLPRLQETSQLDQQYDNNNRWAGCPVGAER